MRFLLAEVSVDLLYYKIQYVYVDQAAGLRQIQKGEGAEF
jgi:hypothetical protein